MTQYNNLTVKSPNSQLNKLKSEIKNGTEVNLNLSSNLIRNFNDETNFPHKLLLTDTQAPKIVQLVGFLFGPPPNVFDSPILLIKEITSLANSIKNSFKEELKIQVLYDYQMFYHNTYILRDSLQTEIQ